MTVRIGMIRIGGYAETHLKAVRGAGDRCRLEAVTIRSPEKYAEMG